MQEERAHILVVSCKILYPINEGEVPQDEKEEEAKNPGIHLQKVWGATPFSQVLPVRC